MVPIIRTTSAFAKKYFATAFSALPATRLAHLYQCRNTHPRRRLGTPVKQLFIFGAGGCVCERACMHACARAYKNEASYPSVLTLFLGNYNSSRTSTG